MKYYYLISGLPDLSFEDTQTAFSVENFTQQLYEILTKSDKKLVQDLFLRYDNENLLAFLRDENAVFNAKGTFSQETIADLVQEIKEQKAPRNKKPPPYFNPFISDFLTGDEALSSLFWEDHLATLYYDYLGLSKNAFIRNWATLNLNIHNVLIALNCRRNGVAHASYIVGNNEVTKNLRTSNARDFELPEIFKQFDQMRHIDEEANLIEKEYKIDRLRWAWIEEENVFKYFTIERVIGYLLQLQMIERWMLLHEDSGRQIFKEIVNNLKNIKYGN